jgi:heme-degrading monooxygenase HmoA
VTDMNADAWVSSSHQPMGFPEFVVVIASITLYASYTVRDSRAVFEAWTKSEARSERPRTGDEAPSRGCQMQ